MGADVVSVLDRLPCGVPLGVAECATSSWSVAACGAPLRIEVSGGAPLVVVTWRRRLLRRQQLRTWLMRLRPPRQ